METGGTEDFEQPIISKDVDGEETKDIQKGESHSYHINIKLPQNISGYESIKQIDRIGLLL
ncbi:MAG TPA: hypothetical protein DEO65_08550 [Bacillus bacterium]|uniref:Uncharacterized protein n=1 Tax=Siminovitchia fordii TaxID=254759 RepID=A0ABQ4K6P6_9BACI|nr:hypothetical protein [Siminovitchia fordii]GIN20852.1 hypothetical protein J1TS3_19860 [Siminovitchia fordii]HBZ09910.1 hypothetical protein [Bacillus sp. (in: firmicutes)]